MNVIVIHPGACTIIMDVRINKWVKVQQKMNKKKVQGHGTLPLPKIIGMLKCEALSFNLLPTATQVNGTLKNF